MFHPALQLNPVTFTTFRIPLSVFRLRQSDESQFVVNVASEVKFIAVMEVDEPFQFNWVSDGTNVRRLPHNCEAVLSGGI